MLPLEYPVIQIAGVLNFDETNYIANAGARYAGFPLVLDFHKEDLTPDEARICIASMNNSLHPVLITYLNTAEKIKELAEYIGAEGVQLHGQPPLKEVVRLAEIAPGLSIIKSLIVEDGNFEDLALEVEKFAPYADAFITDTFDPATGARGATGKTHDWSVSRRITEMSPKPVIAAGGLTPENVGEAIREIRPYGVDVHTGVEDEYGKKDPHLLRQFVANALEAFGLNSDNISNSF
jgi:phosphoribosylanthranilate isomerase